MVVKQTHSGNRYNLNVAVVAEFLLMEVALVIVRAFVRVDSVSKKDFGSVVILSAKIPVTNTTAIFVCFGISESLLLRTTRPNH